MNPTPIEVAERRWRWRPFLVLILLSTGVASIIAVGFAAELKPHVAPQMMGAYTLLWLLVMSYGRSSSRGHRFFAFHVWFGGLLFMGLLGFIHYDDVAGRMIFMDAAQTFVERGEQPRLYWAIGLDGVAALLWTLHLVWLGRAKIGTQRRKSRRSKSKDRAET